MAKQSRSEESTVKKALARGDNHAAAAAEAGGTLVRAALPEPEKWRADLAADKGCGSMVPIVGTSGKMPCGRYLWERGQRMLVLCDHCQKKLEMTTLTVIVTEVRTEDVLTPSPWPLIYTVEVPAGTPVTLPTVKRLVARARSKDTGETQKSILGSLQVHFAFDGDLKATHDWRG